MIIPVPNHEDDRHSDAKAVALAKELGNIMKKESSNIEVVEALQKVRDLSVLRLNQEEREMAVEGMFQFDSSKNISNKKVILVDDVLTAGNIKGQCATILKEYGAQKVWILVAGRTI